MSREKITVPDGLKLPDPLPTRTVGDERIDRFFNKLAGGVLIVIFSLFFTLWAACWFRIYAYLLRAYF